eukprot:748898-Prymnesium_polylepis.1
MPKLSPVRIVASRPSTPWTLAEVRMCGWPNFGACLMRSDPPPICHFVFETPEGISGDKTNEKCTHILRRPRRVSLKT